MSEFDENNTQTLKLYYFGIPGKGEAIRLALNFAGIPFEDCRIDNEIFKTLKENGTLPYGQVPALEITTKTSKRIICQSAAILRFIGRVAKPGLLYPEDPIDAAFVDSVLDAEIDLFTGLAVSRYRGRYGYECIGNPGNPIFDEIRRELNSAVIPRHLRNLEKLLEDSKTGWFAGTEGPSIADFCLAPRLGWLSEHGEGIQPDILNPFVKIMDFMDRFYKHPKIATYYETHTFRFI